jgi:uncharacterized protein YggE
MVPGRRASSGEASYLTMKSTRHAATTLGVRVLRILSIDEEGGNALPIRRIMLATARSRAEEESAPIEAGTLDISANVALDAEIAEPRAQSP